MIALCPGLAVAHEKRAEYSDARGHSQRPRHRHAPRTPAHLPLPIPRRRLRPQTLDLPLLAAQHCKGSLQYPPRALPVPG